MGLTVARNEECNWSRAGPSGAWMADKSRNFVKLVSEEESRLASLHPSTSDVPGCLTLFDTFMQCYSEPLTLSRLSPSRRIQKIILHAVVVGNQIRSLYRYGRGSECSEKWNDVKFCMSLKALEGEERRRAWLRYRAEWWAQRRMGRSSEDVWETRR